MEHQFITHNEDGEVLLPPMECRVVIIIAEELRDRENISVILLGGEMDKKGNCYDAIAIDTIKKLRVEKCFISSVAISPDFGLSIQKTSAIPFFNAVMDSMRI